MEPKSQLLPADVVGTVTQATPEKRTGRKSMSRRSGQNGCIQEDGNWYIVRFWKDVAGQEKRQRVREKICPISGPGKLSASERERKAKEIIATSGVDTVEHFEKVVQSNHGVTFRKQGAIWLTQMRNRRRKPVAPSTLETWECALENWIYPNIGDAPLNSINNLLVKNLVTKMDASGKLGASAIRAYVMIVKMVVASAIDEQGEELYPRNWNHRFIDMPQVKRPEPPAFTGNIVTGIVAAPKKKKHYQMLYILCAAGGLRIGEALGIDIENISPDCSTIKICQKAWRGNIQDFLKTKNGKREIDLHSSVAAMLKDFIGERNQGLLFQSRKGKPLSQSNILRRSLHPILVALGQPKCGAHAFRRFRDTYLKNYTSTPLGLIKYWLGWAEEDMSGVYDKIRQDVEFRKEVAEKAGLGFELPVEKPLVGPNGPKIENEVVLEMAASV
jgi:integrase